jgi:hypothetical protein
MRLKRSPAAQLPLVSILLTHTGLKTVNQIQVGNNCKYLSDLLSLLYLRTNDNVQCRSASVPCKRKNATIRSQ